MRKYEKQLHELFCNSPHLTFLFIMKRGVGITTKTAIIDAVTFGRVQEELLWVCRHRVARMKP